jgi:hypothetical protein
MHIILESDRECGKGLLKVAGIMYKLVKQNQIDPCKYLRFWVRVWCLTPLSTIVAVGFICG